MDVDLPARAWRLSLLAVAIAFLLATPTARGSAVTAARGLADPAHLWTTVDICNTQAHPHVLGLRASMPGTGRRKQRMLMRFRAQFLDAGGQWQLLPGADSGFRDVGSAIFRERRSGWSFVFAPSPGGAQHVLRGLVSFEWRQHKKVVHRLEASTAAGHPSGSQGDPPDFTAASCQF